MNSKESKNKRQLKRKLFYKILCKMIYNIFLILILFGINFNTYQKDFRNQIKTIHKSKYDKYNYK